MVDIILVPERRRRIGRVVREMKLNFKKDGTPQFLSAAAGVRFLVRINTDNKVTQQYIVSLRTVQSM